MKIQIIDTKYIFNHKLFNLWKIPAITYGSMLIYSTIDGLDKIEDYEYIIEIISKCLIYSGFILVFVNMFIFSRIGLLTIDDKEIIIEKYNGYDQFFSLNTIKSVEILGCGRKQMALS